MAQARIGETEKQCDERYGKPASVSEANGLREYEKGGLVFRAHFHEGKCDFISFLKLEASAREISENERRLLLTASGGSRKWSLVGFNGRVLFFETSDGELRAEHSMTDPALLILTREAVLRRDGQEKRTEEEKNLKEF